VSAVEFDWPTEGEVRRTRHSLRRWLAERYPADESTAERELREATEHHAPSSPGERQQGGK
jgi:hypothetical protein